MKRNALWTTMAAMALVLSLMLASIAVVSADTVGSGGGTLSFANGAVQVTVPSGAVSADVDITYASVSGSLPASAPAGTVLGSSGAFTLTANPATNFSRPVDITVAYNAADVNSGGGIYTNVQLYSYDAAFNDWNELASAIRDIPGLTLTTQQNRVGTYAIFVTSAQAPAPTATPGAEEPETGGLAPGSSLLLGLAAVGGLLVLGGGLLFFRAPRRSRA